MTHREKINEMQEWILHLAISIVSVYFVFVLLPTVLPIFKWLYLSALIMVLVIDGFFIMTKRNNLLKINRMLLLYLGAILLVVLTIFYVTKVVVFTDAYGFEGMLKEHLQTAKYIFFFISFAQPILLPIPEAVTIPGASAVFGPAVAAAIAFPGTLLGISAMFFAARYGGRKFISKFIKEEQLGKYQYYVSKNETLIMFLLFIIPILPDEIICVGAGIGQVSPKRFILIASISKLFTATLLAYSVELAERLSLTPPQLMFGFSAFVFILFWVNFLTKKLLSKERGY
ncbi:MULTISPECIES: TVP38/TMEM64 family protein [Mesobacillus]|uniref:TVP38/TMEM64 family protein n=1 Tax=Mesobacillus TaxID=2675231 RepID=UPI001CE29C76|nr:MULTISPECIES: VTT domain-containing protein [Mesobacillus]MCM3575990.1 VTT domain-containing protein [Mesobacillus subterraneus]UYZ22578.1 VTT domain-containing protein [Mesobacillus jeotgali]